MIQTTLKNGQLVLYVSPRSSWCYGRVNNVIGRDVTVEACDDPYPGGDIGIITIPIGVIQYTSSVDVGLLFFNSFLNLFFLHPTESEKKPIRTRENRLIIMLSIFFPLCR